MSKIGKFSIIVLMLFLAFSCFDPVYYYLTSDEKKFINYELNDKVFFIRKIKGDTIVFNVESIQLEYSTSLEIYTRREEYGEMIIVDMKSDEFTITYKIIKNSMLSTYSIFEFSSNVSNTPVNIYSSIQGGFDDYEYSELNEISAFSDRGDTVFYKKDIGISYFTSEFLNERFTLLR